MHIKLSEQYLAENKRSVNDSCDGDDDDDDDDDMTLFYSNYIRGWHIHSPYVPGFLF